MRCRVHRRARQDLHPVLGRGTVGTLSMHNGTASFVPTDLCTLLAPLQLLKVQTC